MQQNYINPETSQLPDIASVKRSLEYRNYTFNQQQLQTKSEMIKRLKMQQIHRYALENEKSLIETENQKLYHIHKKHQVQEILKNSYDTQIYSRHRIKTQEKSHDKFYQENERKMLQNQQRNRINNMSKIYNIGSSQKQRTNYFPNRKILTQGCEDSLDNLKHQSFPQINSRQFLGTPKMEERNPNELLQTQTLKAPKHSLSSIEQPSLQNSRTNKYPTVNLQYSDYLKREIERKQQKKEQQKRKQLQKDKTWIDLQNRAYYENMEDINYSNQKKKYQFASGLDKQLSWKKQYQQRL